MSSGVRLIMKNKNKKFNTIRFNIMVNKLLGMEIKGIKDVKKFYIGLNHLAAQIASNSDLINKYGSVEYGDNSKLRKGIIHILGYGQVIGESKLFKQKPPTKSLPVRKVNLGAFLKKNPGAKSEIKIVQKEAIIYFHTLIKGVLHYTKEEVDKLVDDLKGKFEKEIKEIRDKKIIFPEEKEISIGLLKYKDFHVLYEEKSLKLSCQLIKLCRLFMEKSQTKDTFVSNDTISDCISAKGYISHKNMTKTVSKLRRILKKENKHLRIERVNNEGYILKAHNIR